MYFVASPINAWPHATFPVPDSSSNKVATVYQDAANMIGNGGNGGYGRVITPGSTNLDASRYIGFAAESQNILEYATSKLKKKNLNMIVANSTNVSTGGLSNTVAADPIKRSEKIGNQFVMAD